MVNFESDKLYNELENEVRRLSIERQSVLVDSLNGNCGMRLSEKLRKEIEKPSVVQT